VPGGGVRACFRFRFRWFGAGVAGAASAGAEAEVEETAAAEPVYGNTPGRTGAAPGRVKTVPRTAAAACTAADIGRGRAIAAVAVDGASIAGVCPAGAAAAACTPESVQSTQRTSGVPRGTARRQPGVAHAAGSPASAGTACGVRSACVESGRGGRRLTCLWQRGAGRG
jgi:hypothetical protein